MRPCPPRRRSSSDFPLQSYAASKKGAEVLCHTYHHLYGIDVTVFRYFTVYGPAGRPDMSMFRFTQWISEGKPLRLIGDGEQSRGFTYVDDIARGAILGLKPLGYEIINLGGHETIKINDLIRMLENLIGKKAIIEQVSNRPDRDAGELGGCPKSRAAAGLGATGLIARRRLPAGGLVSPGEELGQPDPHKLSASAESPGPYVES